jgi:hypothetical protein
LFNPYSPTLKFHVTKVELNQAGHCKKAVQDHLIERFCPGKQVERLTGSILRALQSLQQTSVKIESYKPKSEY